MAESAEARGLKTRYSDAYTVAQAIVDRGTLIKISGIVLGGLIVLLGILMEDKSRPGQGVFGGIIFGPAVAIFIYNWGISVSAQGQMLKAMLDIAVNGSPFLTDPEKAGIMSLNRLSPSQDMFNGQQQMTGHWRCLCNSINPQDITICPHCGTTHHLSHPVKPV